MTHTYQITGMTCGSCEARVKSSLLMLPDVTQVEVSKENQSATITMDKHISISNLQEALEEKYSIRPLEHHEIVEQTKSWFSAYKPILIIFAYVTVLSVLFAAQSTSFQWMQAMKVFMAGFFLTFSFFKMLDLEGFAESYRMYDVVARRFNAWPYIYAFLELGLGLAYAINFSPFLINLVTLIVMTVSLIGVLQSVLNKRKIQCACLGAVFNLPMSSVTIIEDALMILMSGFMLLML
jgi:copper chaperone CopZ